MKISAQFTPYYTNYNLYSQKQSQRMSTPAFGSTARFNVMSRYEDYTYATASNMFKSDIDYEDFVKSLDENFAGKEKVNFVCQACSDGSEPYSMAIALIETLGEERAKKYLPIRAFDLDDENIRNAQTGLINLLESDIKAMKKRNIDVDKYFTPSDKKLIFRGDELADRVTTYEVKPILKNSVIFKQESINATLNKLEDASNTVFFCRNVIPYLGFYDSRKTIEKIGKTLSEGSIFSMGNFTNGNFGRSLDDERLIKDCGFKIWDESSNTWIKAFKGAKNPDVNYISAGEKHRFNMLYGAYLQDE